MSLCIPFCVGLETGGCYCLGILGEECVSMGAIIPKKPLKVQLLLGFQVQYRLGLGILGNKF